MTIGIAFSPAWALTATQRSIFLLMMALLVVAVLAVTSIWLGIALRRNRRRRVKDQLHEDKPTGHMNVWAESGRRLHVDPADPDPKDPGS